MTAATVDDEAQMPVGGMKASGYGRFGGPPGVHEVTEVQWVSAEDPEKHYLFQYRDRQSREEPWTSV